MNERRRRLAFEAGQKARHTGKPRTANDRPVGTIYYDDWSDGWADASRRIWLSATPPAKDGGEA